MSPPLAHSWMADPVRSSTNISIDTSSFEVLWRKWKASLDPQMSDPPPLTSILSSVTIEPPPTPTDPISTPMRVSISVTGEIVVGHCVGKSVGNLVGHAVGGYVGSSLCAIDGEMIDTATINEMMFMATLNWNVSSL